MAGYMNADLLRRTFTLRELARLLPLVDGNDDDDGADRWRAALARALRLRTAHPAGPEEDDVVDPYHRSADTYRQMVRELTPRRCLRRRDGAAG